MTMTPNQDFVVMTPCKTMEILTGRDEGCWLGTGMPEEHRTHQTQQRSQPPVLENKCSDRSMEVKLSSVLLANYERPYNNTCILCILYSMYIIRSETSL